MLFFGRSTFVFAKQAEQWRLVAQHNSHVQVDGG
jgi:ketosteroid isomerase-like protein